MLEDAYEGSSSNLGDYWAIMVRRRWWILLPTFACWAIVWSCGWLLPDRYESEALILVEQQKVPEHYVVPNFTIDPQDRVRSITQRILSRTRLQATIDRFHLYPRGRGLSSLLQQKDSVEQMRSDIQIELVQSDGKASPRTGELAAFKIRYFAAAPEVAQQINSELTSLFIDENLKSQQQLSESTTAFLNSQLTDARVKLEEQEGKVREYKAKHLGDLPSQLESNVQILSGLQGQLQSNQRALDGATQQRLYLQSLQQQYRTAMAETGGSDPGVGPEDSLNKELAEERAALASARAKYTEDHPDVAALQEKIAETEALRKQMEKELAAKQKAAPETGSSNQTANGSTSSAMMQVQSQIEANQLEIQNGEKRRKVLEGEISSYQARLNLTPATEQELSDISRGYEESKANYDSLLQKQNQSQLATSLEQRQQGERFSIVDPPSAPLKPFSPNHLLVGLGGLGFGIAVGVGLVALLELTDVRVRHQRDLEGVVTARVLVGIPHLSSRSENHLRRLRGYLEVVAALALIALMAVGNFYSFYKG
jgi:succinoglycan biosynthesis transport protein ExoP